MSRDWYPAVARNTYSGPPSAGDVIAYQHAVWRVVDVVDLPLSDADRDVWLEAGMPDPATWKGRPRRIELEHVGGARPDWAEGIEATPKGAIEEPATQFSHRTWHVYPGGRWPACSCCGEPMPCRAELQDREVAAGLAQVEKLAKRMPGCCWACGEPVTSRQRAVGYPGDNLDLPGGIPVRFHTRSSCFGSAKLYESRWLAQDPRRERALTYPTCAGILVVHGDGSSECQPGECPLGTEMTTEPDCRGHLTHDHAVETACYVGGAWFDRPEDMPGCPRGCRQDGHPGVRTTPRPGRRQSTDRLV